MVVVAGWNCSLVSPGDPFFKEGHCLFMLNQRSLLSSSDSRVPASSFWLNLELHQPPWLDFIESTLPPDPLPLSLSFTKICCMGKGFLVKCLNWASLTLARSWSKLILIAAPLSTAPWLVGGKGQRHCFCPSQVASSVHYLSSQHFYLSQRRGAADMFCLLISQSWSLSLTKTQTRPRPDQTRPVTNPPINFYSTDLSS